MGEPMTSKDLESLLERAETLYRDYSLPSVREWKRREKGLAIEGAYQS